MRKILKAILGTMLYAAGFILIAMGIVFLVNISAIIIPTWVYFTLAGASAVVGGFWMWYIIHND